ncbi:MAG TPA: dephospho-CoA kinase [Gemmataceae bacterium]|jgi:dephospho-CoA kinase|nr:dephospho-CoA kinase [Gemmataceae bacterium]
MKAATVESPHPVSVSPGYRVKPVVGLVGGMGSGKSHVATEFARRGARVISGDELGHEGLRQPEIRDQVVRRWGPAVLDGDGIIDRRKLGSMVFADPAERRALEGLLFPWIERRFREEIAAAEKDPAVPLVVLDAAIMLEAGWSRVCDRLVYIHAPRDVRLRRLAEQRGWTTKEVTARESAQMSLSEKASRADYAVDNSGSPGQLARQVENLLRDWGLQEQKRT